MDPPRREFDNLLAECREQIAPVRRTTHSRRTRLSSTGLRLRRDACATKNNKKWKTANDTLQKIAATIDKLTGEEPLPRARDAAAGSTESSSCTPRRRTARDLKAAREARLREGDADRWEAHCEQCARQIDHMASEIGKIPDDAPKEQALAQVQSYLGRRGLRKKIARYERASRWRPCDGSAGPVSHARRAAVRRVCRLAVEMRPDPAI